MIRAMLCILLTGISCVAASAEELTQAEAVEALERLDVDIMRDETRSERPVTGVDFSFCKTRFRPEFWDLVKPFRDLKSLGLGGCEINDTLLQGIRQFPQLTDVNLAVTKRTTAASLTILSDLSRLESLNIDMRGYGAAGFRELRKFPQLRKLSFWTTHRALAAGLDDLAQCTALVDLSLSDTEITDDELKKLASLQALESLDLGDCPIGNQGLQVVSRLKSLKFLCLDRTKVRDADWSGFIEKGCLEQLSLSHTELSDADIRQIAKIKSLKDLTLDSFHGDGIRGGLVAIAELTQLRTLELSYRHVPVALLEKLAALKDLEVLGLAHSGVTDEGVKHISACRNLNTLVLDNTRITDAGIAQLATLQNLERLAVQGTAVTDAAAIHLGRLSKLTTLALFETQITDEGLRSFRQLKSLQFLNVGEGVTKQGIADFKKQIPGIDVDRIEVGGLEWQKFPNRRR